MLPQHIFPRTELATLQRTVKTPIQFNARTEFSGKNLVRQCINSKHQTIYGSLINELKQRDSSKEDCFRRYIARCRALQC